MQKQGFLSRLSRRRLIIAALSSLAVTAGMLSCSCFVHHNGVFYHKRAAVFVLMVMASLLLAAFSPPENRRWKHSRPAYALLGIVAGGFAFQYLSCAVNETIISLPYLPLMLSLSAVIYTAVWLIAGDSRRAAVWFYGLMLFLGYAYECIYLFRGITFKPLDLLSFGTAMAVAGGYEYPLEFKHLMWLQGGVLFWALGSQVRMRRNTVQERRVKLACTALSAGWIWLLVSTGLLTRWNVVTTAFETDAPYYNRIQGTLATLVKECQQLKNVRPADYAADELKNADARLMETPELSAAFRPDVLVVMNESFADLPALWEIGCTQDPLSFVHQLQQSTPSGDLLVSAYGGSTCNTEHSFLTATIPAPGLNTGLYASVRSDTPSLAWQLKSAGYRTAAIHPNGASNYQRDKVYPRLGFDQFLSLEDFDGAETIRGLVSDRACYDAVLHLLDEKQPGESLFLFTVTMQNHGGYRPEPMEMRTALTGDAADPELEMYLNLAAESDQALRELIVQLEQRQEPTVLLFFGDHQPRLDLSGYAPAKSASAVTGELAQYVTPYVIWANYPLQAQPVQTVSINYLAPLLLQTAGLPLTGYDEWTLEVMQQYPVVLLSGYADRQGEFREWSESDWPGELALMNCLRYNRLLDAPNRLPALEILR